MLCDAHHRAGVGCLHLAGLNLQNLPFKAATQLGAELALVVQRADAAQVPSAAQPRAVHIGLLTRRHGKALVVLLHVPWQPGVGLVDVVDARKPLRLDQPVLQGLEQPLYAALGLGAAGADGLDV